MFFDIFYELCKRKGVSCKKAAEEIGLSNSITTKWKKTGATPSGETLDKVAAYFDVSTDYLLGKTNVHAVDLFKGAGGMHLEEVQKNAPVLQKKNEHTRDGSEIMFALSRGGEQEITDEMFDEVKKFAEYIAQREKGKQ